MLGIVAADGNDNLVEHIEGTVDYRPMSDGEGVERSRKNGDAFAGVVRFC